MRPRLLLIAPLAITLVGVQEMPTSRTVDITLTEGTSMSAAASPDRRWLAIDLLGGLWILPMQGGQAKRITPELLEARQPTWSPDSQSLAFQGYDDGAWHIYVISRDGGDVRPVTSGEFDDREPAWSHDGTRIAFSSDRFGGITTIWEVLVATGGLRRLSERDGAMPSWAPNDQAITFVSLDKGGQAPAAGREPRAGIWAVDADRRERFVLGDARAPIPIGAAWNTNGTDLAYTTAGGHLSINGREVSAPDEDVFPFRPQWISRSEFIYTADGRIKRRSITGPVTVVPFTATVSLQRSTFPIAHRALEPTEPQRLAGIVSPVVSPDGRAIAFSAMGDLWLLPVGGTPVQITNDPAFDVDPPWSPDATQL